MTSCFYVNWLSRMALFVSLATAAIGCGGSYSASVTGNVTLDGMPLTNGTVTFHPVGGGAAAVAQIRSDGTYQLNIGKKEGLAPGEYKVTVVATEPVTPGDEEVIPEMLTPPAYGDPKATPLTREVTRGANDIPIAVVSPPM